MNHTQREVESLARIARITSTLNALAEVLVNLEMQAQCLPPPPHQAAQQNQRHIDEGVKDARRLLDLHPDMTEHWKKTVTRAARELGFHDPESIIRKTTDTA